MTSLSAESSTGDITSSILAVNLNPSFLPMRPVGIVASRRPLPSNNHCACVMLYNSLDHTGRGRGPMGRMNRPQTFVLLVTTFIPALQYNIQRSSISFTIHTVSQNSSRFDSYANVDRFYKFFHCRNQIQVVRTDAQCTHQPVSKVFD